MKAETEKGDGPYYFFNLHREDFLSRYHMRSNVESTFGAIKATMGPSLRSKTPTAMVNDTLCKILAYNITVLIHAMYESSISPSFSGVETTRRETVRQLPEQARMMVG